MIPALVNGFPFVFPDSIDYLIFTPHLYRSPFYGLFIFFFHLNRFIWGPILVQALIASHLLWVLVRIYAGGPSMRWFALVVLTLGLFSSVPFFVGFIMPDFFTAAMILGFYLLGFQWPALSPRERAYFLLLACVAISVHISHLPQALALAILVVVVHLVLGISLRSSLRQAAPLVVPLVLATCATLLNNVLIHRVFALFPAGQTFVLANMIDQGPARRYLREACPAAGFKLCGVLDCFRRNPTSSFGPPALCSGSADSRGCATKLRRLWPRLFGLTRETCWICRYAILDRHSLSTRQVQN